MSTFSTYSTKALTRMGSDLIALAKSPRHSPDSWLAHVNATLELVQARDLTDRTPKLLLALAAQQLEPSSPHRETLYELMLDA